MEKNFSWFLSVLTYLAKKQAMIKKRFFVLEIMGSGFVGS